MTKEVLISLGSNIDRQRNMPAAIAALHEHQALRVLAVSPIYESQPVGGSGPQPPFYNAAARIETDLSLEELRQMLRQIEAQFGRKRQGDRYAPRPLDLDICMVGEEVSDVDGRHIPDPDILRYPHIALPLADVAPTWLHPERRLSLRQIAENMSFSAKEIYQVTDIRTAQTITHSNGHYATETVFEPELGEVYDPEFEALIEQILVRIGEDPSREGLRRTPLRVAKALDYLTSGYTTSLEEVVNNAVFEDPCSEMVVVKGIEFYSMCEHHMLPFFGKAHVAYIPHGQIIGLSKVARVVDVFARRLQVQERLTKQIADALMDILNPLGVGVVVEAGHLCMMMRGVQKQSSSTVTSAMRGTFRSDARTRGEFMELLRQ